MFLFTKNAEMVTPETALPGRETPMQVPERHDVLGTPLQPPFPGMEQLVVGMGCFSGCCGVVFADYPPGGSSRSIPLADTSLASTERARRRFQPLLT